MSIRCSCTWKKGAGAAAGEGRETGYCMTSLNPKSFGGWPSSPFLGLLLKPWMRCLQVTCENSSGPAAVITRNITFFWGPDICGLAGEDSGLWRVSHCWSAVSVVLTLESVSSNTTGTHDGCRRGSSWWGEGSTCQRRWDMGLTTSMGMSTAVTTLP